MSSVGSSIGLGVRLGWIGSGAFRQCICTVTVHYDRKGIEIGWYYLIHPRNLIRTTPKSQIYLACIYPK
jgi:hypothetical protein